MILWKSIAVFCENQMKPIEKICERLAELRTLKQVIYIVAPAL
jgi:hypothetical protein